MQFLSDISQWIDISKKSLNLKKIATKVVEYLKKHENKN